MLMDDPRWLRLSFRPVRTHQFQIALGFLLQNLRVEQALELSAERLAGVGGTVQVGRGLSPLLGALLAVLREGGFESS